jgi:hypothetical protein
MPKLILDKFTTMPISRQRRYQMRRQQEGCCKLCAEPVEKGKLLCAHHEQAAAEHMRTKRSPAWEMI